LGFGSLAMSGNTGLISMGTCCMVGVLATLFTAAFILPWAWKAWPRRRHRGGMAALTPASGKS
jgi:predicted exporter